MSKMKAKRLILEAYISTESRAAVTRVRPTLEAGAEDEVPSADISMKTPLERTAEVLAVPSNTKEDLVALEKVIERAVEGVWGEACGLQKVLPILQYLDCKREKYARAITNGSYVELLVESNGDERERAMEFSTGTTKTSSVSEASCRQVLGQAMNLNCFTWIVSLGLDEQRRLRSNLVVSISLISLLSIGTVETMIGGDRQDIRLPWSSWDMTRWLVRVAAHEIGGVFQVDVGPNEGTKGCTDSFRMLQCNHERVVFL
ncbi:hypothetical protein AXG93_2035s1150 [Marchantia polymorpha subsp. ruderalis]|uniref:Uncharacterized protein n=1 Tax=Marchantia polymorpha subsp. ruderalis TaxID=1480154 RepID=A0A176VPA7_MARPO|nr:hypothetical protein AXG93_2035s1150 [Marchantia polymorpha subsp. ruderalis]